MFRIGRCLDAYEPISFKLGMLLDITFWYSVNTLTFTKGHRVLRNVKFVQSFFCFVFVFVFCFLFFVCLFVFCKVIKEPKLLYMYIRQMTSKKTCKYGEYESFEHLLFYVTISFSGTVVPLSLYNHPTRQAWLSNVYCSGTEDSLQDCGTSQSVQSYCSYSSGPAIRCYAGRLLVWVATTVCYIVNV